MLRVCPGTVMDDLYLLSPTVLGQIDSGDGTLPQTETELLVLLAKQNRKFQKTFQYHHQRWLLVPCLPKKSGMDL